MYTTANKDFRKYLCVGLLLAIVLSSCRQSSSGNNTSAKVVLDPVQIGSCALLNFGTFQIISKVMTVDANGDPVEDVSRRRKLNKSDLIPTVPGGVAHAFEQNLPSSGTWLVHVQIIGPCDINQDCCANECEAPDLGRPQWSGTSKTQTGTMNKVDVPVKFDFCICPC